VKKAVENNNKMKAIWAISLENQENFEENGFDTMDWDILVEIVFHFFKITSSSVFWVAILVVFPVYYIFTLILSHRLLSHRLFIGCGNNCEKCMKNIIYNLIFEGVLFGKA
jgi:hypothetical protein